jgi:transposase-like protein
VPGRPHSDEAKQQALAVYQRGGLPAAVKATGIPKPTIKRWVEAAGISTDAANEAALERTRAATEAHKAQVDAETAKARAALIPKLAFLANQTLDIELHVAAQIKAGKGSGLPEGVRLRDIVGSRTRAVHDLNLLTGEATERTEGAAVLFLAPRPDRRNPQPIVDLSEQHTDMPQVIEGTVS